MAYPIYGGDDPATRAPDDRSVLMPADADIPPKYKTGSTLWGQKLATDLLGAGVRKWNMVPKPGIDGSRALWHLKRLIDAEGLTKNRQATSIAFLLDEWFDGFESTWSAVEPVVEPAAAAVEP